MYGLIGKMTAAKGERDALWVTEVWDSKASHDASLPLVQAAIAKAVR